MNAMQFIGTAGAVLVVLSGWWTVAAQTRGQERVEFPRDFRRSMSLYSTVDRSDGKVYEIFVNRTALASWRTQRRLPHGTQFVIESFNAQRDANGTLRRDAQNRLIKGESDFEIHVSEKRNDWARNDEQTTTGSLFGAPAQNGAWRVGAFDPRDGRRIAVNIAECHQCHTDRRAEDFHLSRGLLDGFARSNQPSHISFTCEKREICFGTP
jgi:hypothetical protein